MRTTVVAAALLVCLSAIARAYDLQTKNGQAVCDSLRAFEELTIAINTDDDQFIEEIGNNGCRMPPPGVRMELIEAYPDETVLLFSKLAEYTRIGPVPDHIERLTHLAKVRVLTPDHAPSVGFTLLRVSPRSVGQ
jgi:hypothetical protein